MEKTITMIFHNLGLRSYIEVDLCRECPREDDKGCCGYYSPIFYPCDFAYLLENHTDLLDHILHLPGLTILDYSLTVNNTPEGNSYRCRFHSKAGGCKLQQLQRESICRHFVCPGIDWEKEESLQPWKEFFISLADYENKINLTIGEKLAEKGLTLRDTNHHQQFFEQLLILFKKETAIKPDFFAALPLTEEVKLKRTLTFKADWPL